MIGNVSLGGFPLTSGQVFLQSFNNGSFPATVYSRSKRGGFSGSKLVTPTFSSYQFVLTFEIIGLTFADLNTQRFNFFQILGLVHSLGVQTMVITKSDGSLVQIDIKAIQVTGDYSVENALSCMVQVTLEAEYPLLQSTTQTIQSVQIYNGGGFAIPFGIPLDMSADKSTVLEITNNGNYEAYPVFTFIGKLTNPSIANNTSGKTLSLTQTLADDTLSVIVDTYLRTVLLEPSGNVGRQYVTGDFWTVPVGVSNVTLGNANTTDGGQCVITFRDTFLNI
jgi:hypothetical protein